MFIMLGVPGIGEPNRLPLWLTVLVISRDVAIVMTVAIFNLAVARRTFRPTVLGKAATVVFVTTVVVTLYANYRGEPMVLVDVCVYAALAITVASSIEYAARMMRPSSE
jgi:phosphatidylglycerophosphate synthase